MEYIYVGKIVNTHGIKGELRIISDFKYKKDIFKKDFKLYIGAAKEEMIVENYRKHKIYDMVLFCGINNINEVLKYKNECVYAKRSDINVDGYFNEDLIGLNVYVDDNKIGEITEILTTKAHEILVIKNNKKKYMVPNIPEFIDKIDLDNNRINIIQIEGLIDEN